MLLNGNCMCTMRGGFATKNPDEAFSLVGSKAAKAIYDDELKKAKPSFDDAVAYYAQWKAQTDVEAGKFASGSKEYLAAIQKYKVEGGPIVNKALAAKKKPTLQPGDKKPNLDYKPKKSDFMKPKPPFKLAGLTGTQLAIVAGAGLLVYMALSKQGPTTPDVVMV